MISESLTLDGGADRGRALAPLCAGTADARARAGSARAAGCSAGTLASRNSIWSARMRRPRKIMSSCRLGTSAVQQRHVCFFRERLPLWRCRTAGADAFHPGVEAAARGRHDVLACISSTWKCTAVGTDLAVAREQFGCGAPACDARPGSHRAAHRDDRMTSILDCRPVRVGAAAQHVERLAERPGDAVAGHREWLLPGPRSTTVAGRTCQVAALPWCSSVIQDGVGLKAGTPPHRAVAVRMPQIGGQPAA